MYDYYKYYTVEDLFTRTEFDIDSKYIVRRISQ